MIKKPNPLEPTYKAIIDIVPEGASVLDLGCGHGELLQLLTRAKKVKGQGIEINEQAIYECVARGLSVFHDDLDRGLLDYTDDAFDFVIMNQTLQEVRRPDTVLEDAMRVGRRVIVGFPNFVYYDSRFQLFFCGTTPVNQSLPFEWYNTPNLHFLSILDFTNYCRKKKITIERTVYIGKHKTVRLWPNLRAQYGIFVISRQK